MSLLPSASLGGSVITRHEGQESLNDVTGKVDHSDCSSKIYPPSKITVDVSNWDPIGFTDCFASLETRSVWYSVTTKAKTNLVTSTQSWQWICWSLKPEITLEQARGWSGFRLLQESCSSPWKSRNARNVLSNQRWIESL